MVGDGVALICNNLTDVARYIRSVQFNDNSLDDVPRSCQRDICLVHTQMCLGCELEVDLCVPPSGDPVITQALRFVGRSPDHWDVETLKSARFTKRAKTQILTFEFHM